MTSAAASPPRTSSRLKRKQLNQKQEMNATRRAVAANPLGDPPVSLAAYCSSSYTLYRELNFLFTGQNCPPFAFTSASVHYYFTIYTEIFLKTPSNRLTILFFVYIIGKHDKSAHTISQQNCVNRKSIVQLKQQTGIREEQSSVQRKAGSPPTQKRCSVAF